MGCIPPGVIRFFDIRRLDPDQALAGSASERLYARAGSTRVGTIPNYALMPDGALTPTTFFYKDLT